MTSYWCSIVILGLVGTVVELWAVEFICGRDERGRRNNNNNNNQICIAPYGDNFRGAETSEALNANNVNKYIVSRRL